MCKLHFKLLFKKIEVLGKWLKGLEHLHKMQEVQGQFLTLYVFSNFGRKIFKH